MRTRVAVRADAEALGLVNVRSWQAAYRGLMPQSYLDGLDPERRADGWRRWLWVLETNERARRFYEAAGWRPDGGQKIDEYFGFPLAEVRYRRSLTGG